MRFQLAQDIVVEIDRSYTIEVKKRNGFYEVVAWKILDGGYEENILFITTKEYIALIKRGSIEEILRRK